MVTILCPPRSTHNQEGLSALSLCELYVVRVILLGELESIAVVAELFGESEEFRHLLGRRRLAHLPSSLLEISQRITGLILPETLYCDSLHLEGIANLGDSLAELTSRADHRTAELFADLANDLASIGIKKERLAGCWINPNYVTNKRLVPGSLVIRWELFFYIPYPRS